MIETQKCGRFFLTYGRGVSGSPNKHGVFDYDKLDGHAFEEFCADLLRYNGFCDVQVTPGSGDFGIDILGNFKGTAYAIQCKCYANTVGNKAVQEVYTGKTFYHCKKAVVITNNYFTVAAEETARMTDVELWDRGRLNDLYHNALRNGYIQRNY